MIQDDPNVEREREVMLAYKELFSTPQGQVVWGDLERRFGFSFNSTFTGDATRAVYCEGQRSVLIHIGRQVTLEMADATSRPREGELDATDNKEGDDDIF